MASLIVLFEGQPDAGRIGEALLAAGLLDTDVGAAGGTQIGLVVDGTRLELELVEAQVRSPLLDEAISLREGDRAFRAHSAHIRVRTPELAVPGCGWGPSQGLREMGAATLAAGALLSMPGAIALLDESSGVLTDVDGATQRLSSRLTTPPLDLWINVRSFELADAQGWFFDTFGMAQLDLPDLEAYSSDGAGALRMEAWLRMVCLHLAQTEAPLRPGDTLDGPDDGPWLTVADESTVQPRRAVLRFVPINNRSDNRGG